MEITTINNLKSVGFTGVNEQTVLLKGEFSKMINGKENTSKQWRVDAVKNGSADRTKYTVIALIGDNLMILMKQQVRITNNVVTM
ncbi:hypothetical protein [Nostoc sp. NOS(2021)]|uniref:hypothetical protein n=1 Tax=Nostoc sp. NOS(2021) TaxID=2815407 RepID=UPI0025ECBA0E|nr:hypothetical protein [Nostoc sp. NOS(2021)]